ncbi:RNA polymerase sigma factor [Anaerotaenia torta]|uniref:RNA polymerase sigma factor n=1 Tax=Anaerotaenia torta TaxID=433293 RepID=UPI003D1CE6CE
MTNHDIDHLITRIAQGDDGALEALYNGMKRPVYFYALQLSGSQNIAEDAMQDTFISIMSHCGSYQAKGNGRAWFMTITRNKVFDLLRKQKHFSAMEEAGCCKAYFVLRYR